jgi:GTP cyclohydrolase I
MTTPAAPPALLPTAPIPDVQSASDPRGLDLDEVGIRQLKLPVGIPERTGGRQMSVGTFTLAVSLAADRRGIHMSRLVEIVHDLAPNFTPDRALAALEDMSRREEADRARLEVVFPFFRRKKAPVSGRESLLDYTVTWTGARCAAAPSGWSWILAVPVTTLCPCSREISLYGAHSQRARVTLALTPQTAVDIETGLDLVEAHASAELFALLKRSDEKYVTERAFERPRFAEDLARDIACALRDDRRFTHFRVTVENFETIHNHSAFASVSRPSED